jgi:hypothetical protein
MKSVMSLTFCIVMCAVAPGQPRLDPEFMVDTTIFYVSTTGLQTEPAVAFDGTNYFVVWEDHRDGTDIYGARVTPDGVVLDRTGIAISEATGSQGSPAVAFDGTNYLVVWDDTRSGSGNDIYGARVSPAGTVLDRTGFAISTAMRIQYAPAVAFGGTDYFVVWTDGRRGGDQTDVYGARVTTAGSVLDTAGIPVGLGPYHQLYPALAYDGTNYLVTWEYLLAPGFSDIHGARVSTSGTVLDSIVICSADSGQAASAVAFDGTNYLVAWEDERSSPAGDIYCARVSQAGSVLDPEGIEVSTTGAFEEEPVVAFDGFNYIVAWQDLRSASNDIYAARVASDGAVLDTAGVLVSDADDSQTIPALAFDGTNFLAVWKDLRSTSGDIYGARIGPDGVVLDTAGIAVTATVNVQYNPAVAFDGTNYLVAWSDDRNGELDIYGARVSQTGDVLDARALAISTADSVQNYPAISFDGTNFLVTWEDERNDRYCDIYGARVTPDGTVLDRSGFAVSAMGNLQKAPVLDFDGTNYMVVWQDFRDATNYKIYGARVTTGRAVLDSIGIPISTQNCYQYAPGIAFDGTNYLVAWMDHRSDPYYDIYGARVSPGGAVLDSTGFVVSNAVSTQRYPSISSDGSNCLVVWDDGRNSADIYGARVTPSGTVLDPAGLVIYTAPGLQYTPKLAFDGTDWLVVWKDGRSSGSNIYGARVDMSGVTVDSFVVSQQSDDQHAPAIACGTGDNALAAYISWTGTLSGSVYDAFRIWTRPAPFSPIGIGEDRTGQRVSSSYQAASVVRGELRYEPTANSLQLTAPLLDISGRRVMELKPGFNDIRRLAPGVYFIRGPMTEDGRPSTADSKVVVQK